MNCCSIISQVIIYLKVLKRWNVCLRPRVALLVVHLSPSHSLLVWFGFLRTSSRSARCSLVSISIFRLCCSTTSYSVHSWLVSVWIFAVLVSSTPRSWSARCWLVSIVERVCFNLSCFVLKPRLALLADQLSLAAIWILLLSSDSFLKAHVSFTQAFEYLTFFHRFEFGFCLAAFCTFVIAFLKRLPSTQPSHAVAKRTAVDRYKYIY